MCSTNKCNRPGKVVAKSDVRLHGEIGSVYSRPDLQPMPWAHSWGCFLSTLPCRLYGCTGCATCCCEPHQLKLVRCEPSITSITSIRLSSHAGSERALVPAHTVTVCFAGGLGHSGMAKAKKGRRVSQQQSANARRNFLADKRGTPDTNEGQAAAGPAAQDDCAPLPGDAAGPQQAKPRQRVSDDAESLRVPPVRGLANQGNTCFMNSTLQVCTALSALSSIQGRLVPPPSRPERLC